MKTKERGIRFEDCHVGDVLRLKTRCPFVEFYLTSEEIPVAKEDKVTATVVHKEKDILDVIVHINGKDVNYIGIVGLQVLRLIVNIVSH